MDIIIPSTDAVKINVSNSQNDFVSFEKKYQKSLTISDLKSKFEMITGGCAATMKLELYNGDTLVTKLDDNEKFLGFYPIEDGMRIHVIDNFQFVQENVQKFELSDDQYENRNESVRSFLKKNKLGKYNEAEMKQMEEKRKEEEAEELRLAELCKVGLRCRVTTKDQPTRLGTIMYNGPLDGKKGIFIGVKFDEPLGANDGTSNGKRYFECQPKYGSFVLVSAVEVGDFPPEEFDLDDEL